MGPAACMEWGMGRLLTSAKAINTHTIIQFADHAANVIAHVQAVQSGQLDDHADYLAWHRRQAGEIKSLSCLLTCCLRERRPLITRPCCNVCEWQSAMQMCNGICYIQAEMHVLMCCCRVLQDATAPTAACTLPEAHMSIARRRCQKTV
jgi:hypothetical protein